MSNAPEVAPVLIAEFFGQLSFSLNSSSFSEGANTKLFDRVKGTSGVLIVAVALLGSI